MATLNVDLNDVPDDMFQRRLSPHGVSYYKLLLNIEISLESALEFFVTVNGMRYGSLTAIYEAYARVIEEYSQVEGRQTATVRILRLIRYLVGQTRLFPAETPLDRPGHTSIDSGLSSY